MNSICSFSERCSREAERRFYLAALPSQLPLAEEALEKSDALPLVTLKARTQKCLADLSHTATLAGGDYFQFFLKIRANSKG
jgi:hypothetical protein